MIPDLPTLTNGGMVAFLIVLVGMVMLAATRRAS